MEISRATNHSCRKILFAPEAAIGKHGDKGGSYHYFFLQVDTSAILSPPFVIRTSRDNPVGEWVFPELQSDSRPEIWFAPNQDYSTGHKTIRPL